MISPIIGFVTFLLVTVALLGAVVATGRAAKRKIHLTLVVITVASLGITIFYAEQLGKLYDLEAAGAITPIHLMIAKITVFAYLFPIVTGILTFRGNRSARRWHARFAYTVLLLTVLTAATGSAMILMSERL